MCVCVCVCVCVCACVCVCVRVCVVCADVCVCVCERKGDGRWRKYAGCLSCCPALYESEKRSRVIDDSSGPPHLVLKGVYVVDGTVLSGIPCQTTVMPGLK